MTTMTPTLTIHPNLFHIRTTITFELPEKQYAAVTVHDLNGQLITVLLADDYLKGTYILDWDGRDSAGFEVPAGSYLICLQTTARRETQRVVFAR